MNFPNFAAFWAAFQSNLAPIIASALAGTVTRVKDLLTRMGVVEGYFTEGKANDAVKFDGKTYAQALSDIQGQTEQALRDIANGGSATETLKSLRDDIGILTSGLSTTNGNVGTVQGDLANLTATVNAFISNDDEIDLNSMAELKQAILDLQSSDQNIMGQYVRLSSASAQVIDSDIELGSNVFVPYSLPDSTIVFSSGTEYDSDGIGQLSIVSASTEFQGLNEGDLVRVKSVDESVVYYTGEILVYEGDVLSFRGTSIPLNVDVKIDKVTSSEKTLKAFEITATKNGTHNLSEKANQVDVDTAVAAANAAAADAIRDAGAAQSTADSAATVAGSAQTLADANAVKFGDYVPTADFTADLAALQAQVTQLSNDFYAS